MAKIMSLSLLALCALLLPTHGQAELQAAGLKTGDAGAGSHGSDLHWLPRPGLGRRCPRRREVVKRCVSSTCGEYKCSDLYRFRQRVCTADCRTGCFCAWPFFRNNDGRCVHFWRCYTYRRPSWSALRPSGASDQGAGEYPAGSGSASVPGSWGGAVSGTQPGSNQWAGASASGWPSGAVLVPGGAWGSVNGAPSGGWGSGAAQYPGSWGVSTYPQYPNGWSSGVGNGVSGGSNGGLVIGSGGVGSSSGGFGTVNGGFGSGSGAGGSGSGGFGVGSGSFGVAGGSLGGSTGVLGNGLGVGGSASSGFGSVPGGGALGSSTTGVTNVKAQG
ncbi:uncharacterized protein LOC119400313 isoform X2 [Rhipicephalus sanguineus]|uniref:uncharacterized protein LOC119400313 isoform X2 n=1 Tax=Rhipicephalus sanguineus TaxID=34632 RepID=UPI0018957C00|nr:uncharacterized protein LOC119400313 isoform X2 [Rhipicephalus sanguineus]